MTRFVFIVEWFDTGASLLRNYHLTYHPDDTIEMDDLKAHKKFLKRSAYPALQLKDLYLGAVVTVHARQLKVIGYADQFTETTFSQKKEKTFAMIKPDAYINIGKILEKIE